MTGDATKKRVEVALASLLVLTALLMGGDAFLHSTQQALTYSEFKVAVKKGQVREATIGSDVFLLPLGPRLHVKRHQDCACRAGDFAERQYPDARPSKRYL